MSSGKIISRSSLYDSDEVESNDEGEYQMPYSMDFEFVEVEQASEEEKVNVNEEETVDDKADEVKEQDDEFEFPLFSFGSATTNKSIVKDETSVEDKKSVEEERGRSKTKVMKISLREESLETVKRERPQSYYFSNYSQQEKEQFLQVAVTGEDIYAQLQLSIQTPIAELKPWRVINLNEYNEKIDQELLKQKIRSKHRREGKKKRITKIVCRERKLERVKLQKKIEKDQKAKLKKKMFHKRGGKKNKKSTGPPSNTSTNSKPKYRTE
ncbi:hypothetical protein DFJ63DRAFT_101541 [Scheffersomyces coipomensis]|uniref:uncharacterized protein n=1 Tax=Scheffersomyces coipomensis TaxID=1788519 RepID=UPI00315D0088